MSPRSGGTRGDGRGRRLVGLSLTAEDRTLLARLGGAVEYERTATIRRALHGYSAIIADALPPLTEPERRLVVLALRGLRVGDCASVRAAIAGAIDLGGDDLRELGSADLREKLRSWGPAQCCAVYEASCAWWRAIKQGREPQWPPW